MILQPQFRDLIEINGINFYADEKGPYKNITDRFLKQVEERATTEFIFGCASPGSAYLPLLKKGFKEISRMGNWWPTHAGEERELTLLWKRNKNFKNLSEPPVRTKWYHDMWGPGHANGIMTTDLAASGCGFKLIARVPEKRLHWRYFTLVRLPIKVSAATVENLTALGYRKFDEGSMASYWVNGQNPETFTFQKEYKFLGTTKCEGCREYIGE